MDETTPLTEPDFEAAPQIPSEPVPPPTSRFLFVDVAALRAKQLRRGARPRLGENAPHVPHKPERLAMEEVRQGLVLYDVPELKPPRGSQAEA
jgi:DNA-directed RNA polymerase subunit K/omega